MNFIKRLVIQYILICTIPFILMIISNINPYFLLSSTFGLLLILFYLLLGVNIYFSLFYMFSNPRVRMENYKECFDKFGYKVIICHLCDYYLKCKERKFNERNI